MDSTSKIYGIGGGQMKKNKLKCGGCKYYPCNNIGIDIKKCKEYKPKETYNLQSFSYSILGGANDKRRTKELQISKSKNTIQD